MGGLGVGERSELAFFDEGGVVGGEAPGEREREKCGGVVRILHEGGIRVFAGLLGGPVEGGAGLWIGLQPFLGGDAVVVEEEIGLEDAEAVKLLKD